MLFQREAMGGNPANLVTTSKLWGELRARADGRPGLDTWMCQLAQAVRETALDIPGHSIYSPGSPNNNNENINKSSSKDTKNNWLSNKKEKDGKGCGRGKKLEESFLDPQCQVPDGETLANVSTA
ncbi:hypothetical protein PoB_001599700 [Plakobranchus ocellatus]|uniref:Uncharacterized protein n=1 Tax=Plakobranchus ocellatus TaxID=259542 RepID=A0AAV3Z2P0_9GAST|nr:hypothetical protein PoB_001599700 [Plakobranchus ocellatus]